MNRAFVVAILILVFELFGDMLFFALNLRSEVYDLDVSYWIYCVEITAAVLLMVVIFWKIRRKSNYPYLVFGFGQLIAATLIMPSNFDNYRGILSYILPNYSMTQWNIILYGSCFMLFRLSPFIDKLK